MDMAVETTYPVDTSVKPEVKMFFEADTNTFSYVVKDPGSEACAIVDSVLDYDPASGRTSTKSAEQIVAYVKDRGLAVEWLIETHVHADHLSAAPFLQERLGGKLGIGAHIKTVQETFGKVFNAGTEFARDGSQFDRLFEDGDTYTVGGMTCFAMHTPGHTPACMVHVMGDAAFVGDTIFMPDAGSARCDFPGGDAKTLFRSIKKLLSLPAETRLFMCHDYGADGSRDILFETTVAEERAKNVHVHDGVAEADFVEMRTSRDAKLGMPRLILPSIQVNMRAGAFPPPEDNGVSYLKIPLNAL